MSKGIQIKLLSLFATLIGQHNDRRQADAVHGKLYTSNLPSIADPTRGLERCLLYEDSYRVYLRASLGGKTRYC